MRGRATRRRAELSQHFLRRGALASSLVEGISVQQSDLVLEIGAGRGALTRELAPRVGRLVAVELDGRLARALTRELGDRVDVVHGDFLEVPLPRADYKVIGNLPYSRTTDIVRRLTRAHPPPEDAWLVVQREAARRFAGTPFGPESRWSLRLKPRFQVEIVRTLRRVDFDPPPSVESVLLWLARRPRSLIEPRLIGRYTRFVDAAIAAPTVRKALAARLSRTQQARLARQLGFALDAKPASLTFDQWLAVFRFCASQRRCGP